MLLQGIIFLTWFSIKAHFNTTINHVIRPNGSVYQNYYFDPKTGAALGGGTKQGSSDETCWSRGQAWTVYGLPLSYAQLKDEGIFEKNYLTTDYFLSNLPEDYVPYWDLIFRDGDGEPKDSSAAAIAVCGLLEACKWIPDNDEHKKLYYNAARLIMNSLIDKYTTKDEQNCNGLLMHATYYKAGNIGVDECNIWGDYFYMEALMRFLNPYWKKYW